MTRTSDYYSSKCDRGLLPTLKGIGSRALGKLKRLYTHINVLGTYWVDYRDDWLTPTRSDGRPDRVLDAGCGEGSILTEFRRFGVEVDYHGVDLAVGEADWSYEVSAIADLHALPFKTSSFDKVICNQVLEHVDRPDEVLGQLVRVLRPGGSLFVSVPFVWHLHQEPHDRFRFSLHALTYLATRHGLTVVLIRPQGGYFSVIRYVLSSHTLVTAQLPQPLRKLGELADRLYRLTDFVVVAPLCYFLDKLDHTRKLTLGYFLHLVRPGLSEKALPEDPYCCPLCSAFEADLIRQSERWICSQCGTAFTVREGVPNLTPMGAYVPVSGSIAGCLT